MPPKKFDEFQKHESCCFCKLDVTDILYGPIYKSRQKYQNNYLVVHYHCLLMASHIKQNGKDHQGILGFFPRDIISELKRGSTKSCFYCNRLGATVQCVHKDCDKNFHLPCGIQKGSVHQFYQYFDSYCHLHRPKQNIPAKVFKQMKDTCVICSLDIDKRNKYHCLWPVCCKPSILIHRRCIQTMACNAGYYFKCPLCNDTEKFKSEMNRLGIYIPQQDASWELEPNAYQELGVRGSGCESKNCVCPKGKDYSRENTPWQIELCKVCGGNGIHLGCTNKWTRSIGYNYNWFCDICKPVYLENNGSCTSQTSSREGSADSENSNDSVHMSSGSSEKPEDILQQTSNVPDNRKPVGPILAQIGTRNSSELDTDILIVLSEDEEPAPVAQPDKPAPVAQPDKPAPVAQPDKPAPPVEPPQPAQPPQRNQDSSDDDLQIVGVMAGKRRKRDLIARKRLRTAPWIEDSNSVRQSCGTSSMEFTISNISKDSPTANQPWSLKRKLVEPESQFDSANQSSLAVALQAAARASNPPKLFKEGNDIPSNIGLNLNEVSINKIVLKTPRTSETVSQIIDLSCDDDLDEVDTENGPPQSSGVGDPCQRGDLIDNKVVSLKSLLVSPLIKSYNEIPLTSVINRRIEAWMQSDRTPSLQTFTNSTDNNQDRSPKKNDLSPLKNCNSTVTLQVTLSSDEEEIVENLSKPSSSKTLTQFNNPISNKPFSNQKSLQNEKPCENNSRNNILLPIQNCKYPDSQLNRVTKNNFSHQITSPSPSAISMIKTPSGLVFTCPIDAGPGFQNTLSNYNKNMTQTNLTSKPDDLIVIDDDDDDEDVPAKPVSFDRPEQEEDDKQANDVERLEAVQTRPESPFLNKGIGVITNVTSLADPHIIASFDSNDQVVSSTVSLELRHEDFIDVNASVKSFGDIKKSDTEEACSAETTNMEESVSSTTVDGSFSAQLLLKSSL